MNDTQITKLLKKTFIDYSQSSEFVKTPMIFTAAKGLYYWDVKGKKYFDAIGGIFVASLGHGHPVIIEALVKQAEIMTFAPPLHGISDIGLQFVEKLGSITPGNLNFVKGFCGGSEANEASFKFVRQYFKQNNFPQKYKIISNYLSYHGGTLATVSASGGASRKLKFEPEVPGFKKMFSPFQFRNRFASWEEACRFSAEMFEEKIICEGPDSISAIILEPICNTGGIITPTDEYFRILRNICDRYNVSLIYDEVLTGIGKTGDMFAADTFGVAPDILCIGKGLSSGVVPLAAMAAREDMGDTFYGALEENIQFAHGHTFANNPLSSAVGIAVIDEIIGNQLHIKAREKGTYLFSLLSALKEKIGFIREVRGKGLLLGVELDLTEVCGTDKEKIKRFGKVLKETALENGLIMRIDPTWFAVAPALIAEKEDLDIMVALIEKTLLDSVKKY